MRLILVGPPGSGKGTQAKLLHQRLGLTHISTGDILREAIRLGTPAGRRAKPYMDGGQLAPDDLVNEVVAELFRRDDRPEKFVLDGYPRTIAQAASFDQVLRQQFLDVSAVVVLRVDDDEIVRRLSGRRVCPACKATFHAFFNPPKKPWVCDVCGTALVQRPDDREETIRGRLRIYHQSTEALVSYYASRDRVHEVRGVGDIEAIYQSIQQALGQVGPSC